MNKKGDASPGFWIILVVIFLIIVFIAAAGSFGLFFKKVTDSVKGILGFSSSQLEELKGVEEAKRGEAERASVMQENCKFLEDAADFIKKGKYDEAVEKYVGYYEVYDERVNGDPSWCYGVNTADSVKFRILNALREKTYLLAKEGKDAPKYNELNELIKPIISQQEFTNSIILMKLLGHLKGDIQLTYEDNTFLKEYLQRFSSGSDQLNSEIYSMIKDYESFKRKVPGYCSLKSFEGVKSFVNGILKSGYEYEHTPEPNKNILNAFDFTFLSEPYKDVQDFCRINNLS